jgi:hypothetical protein
MVSFGILTVSHRRDNVLWLWCASIARLRLVTGINFPVVVVGDAHHKLICERYGIHHIAQVNDPVSQKWNTGVRWLMEQGVTYAMISGSDDIVSSDTLLRFIVAMEYEPDMIGIKSIWFYAGDGKLRGTLKRLESNQPLGVCRTFHRRVIEQVGDLWTQNKGWGMDADNARNTARYCKKRAYVEGDVFDVKTQFNLNRMTSFPSKLKMAYDPNIFYNILSTEEKDILNLII